MHARWLRIPAMAALLLALLIDTALAQATPAPTPDKGDTAWMLVASALVLMMTVPGLALYYGGLVRTKNMLSMCMQVFATLCLVAIIWVLYGYSMAFTNGGGLNDYVGGFGKAFLSGVDSTTVAATFSNGVYIPEYVYIAFQMTFACITPALILGAIAERVKFSAVMLFMALWVTFIYFPIAHMVWYWGGPDIMAEGAKAGAEKLAEVAADAGLLFKMGALDFAGGTVVHINAGIAGLVAAVIVGRRHGYGSDNLAPYDLSLAVIGTVFSLVVLEGYRWVERFLSPDDEQGD